MSTCKTATRPPRTFLKMESSNITTMFLTNSPGNRPRFFWNFACTLRKSTLKVDPGSQKWPKSVILQKIKQLLLRPTRELIFSVKCSYLPVLTGNNHPRPGKILYIEKNGTKLTKNRFFGYGILTTFTKSRFSTMKSKNNYTKI